VKILYATDLHGNTKQYDAVYKTALHEKVDVVHIGADLLPKTGTLESQQYFVTGFLKDFVHGLKVKKIPVLAFFGNDDVWAYKHLYKEYAPLLDEMPQTIGGYTFKAYPYVPDYPFNLKTACKLDYKGWLPPSQWEYAHYGPADIDDYGALWHIPDFKDYLVKKGTIEEDLKAIGSEKKLVMSFHCPPAHCQLDELHNGQKVGSESIYQWILKEQPSVVLCGHIHESPEVTGSWKAAIGKTLVIQPGQSLHSTTMVLITLGKTITANRMAL
jgi:uncharacterized protein